ncbi:unnamed protein product [Rotaria magnacalcarata]|uniref:GB1/RHD3-type G domain-containing protein n=1 Tax=Rotaria magnacalcarata TaxID=392030 RepID=A0A817AA26_9BILA|nr:unnamed protein product [Rotaria magnacalcarata]CAF2260874.1 unnamed protein product [Rotaria magnacalcarata]
MKQSLPVGPVEIVTLTDDKKFKLNEEKLRQILYHERAIGKKISLVSIVGNAEWIGQEDEPLTGFSWRSGPTRHTIGILMWSEPFLLRLPNGEEIAVFLMDTQGTYDSNSTGFENTFIFALTLLQLTFLVRDWQFKKDRRYGFEGGEEYLLDCLKIQEKQPNELKLLRSRLRQCFCKVNCLLMPHLGLQVTTGEDFDGKLACKNLLFFS